MADRLTSWHFLHFELSYFGLCFARNKRHIWLQYLHALTQYFKHLISSFSILAFSQLYVNVRCQDVDKAGQRFHFAFTFLLTGGSRGIITVRFIFWGP